VTVAILAVLWTWETLFPLVAGRKKRLRHAGRNVTIAVMNTVMLALLFGAATVGVASWGMTHNFGLLNWLDVSSPWRLPGAILLLDGWLYAWHRLNHRVPLLWRFHRMHHSDPAMDVTTATRFHLGEHLGAATLRLGLIPLFGVSVGEILIFETLVVANTMLHHANISLGPLDAPLRWLLVTPRMHQIHHSRYRHETDSNYAVLFSFWDRLFGSYQMRAGAEPVELGLSEFDDDRWQTVAGMLKTPFAATRGNVSDRLPTSNIEASSIGRSETSFAASP
jgi:sterol desaturase/sphingolipid hydroxylase (fatty acid hydroxylase superfamily)